MKIITYATHAEGLFNELVKNEDVVVLGYNTKWKGFVHRDNVILEYLNTLPETEVVAIVDGFDTIIKKTDGLLEAFEKMDCKVLFAQEDKSGFSDYIPSFLEKYIKSKVFGICKDGLTANCGLSMGYVYYWKILLQIIIDGSSDDDQRNLNESCNRLPFLKIDYKKEIFENCTSMESVKKSKAFICQIPGEMSWSRIKRAMVEYPKYFIAEIIILILILILILFYVLKKKKKLKK